MGYGIYPMAIGQSEWDKFSGDRIPVHYIHLRSDFKSITKCTLLQNKRGKWFRAPPTVHLRTDDVT